MLTFYRWNPAANQQTEFLRVDINPLHVASVEIDVRYGGCVVALVTLSSGKVHALTGGFATADAIRDALTQTA